MKVEITFKPYVKPTTGEIVAFLLALLGFAGFAVLMYFVER